jgi:hypothetical protein
VLCRYTGALCGCVYVFTLPALLKMKIERDKGVACEPAGRSRKHAANLPLPAVPGTLTTSSKVLHYGLIVIGFVILAGQFVPST